MIKMKICPTSKTITFTSEREVELDLKKVEEFLETQGFNITNKTNNLVVGVRSAGCADSIRLSVLRNGKILARGDEKKVKDLEKLVEHIFNKCSSNA